MITRVSSIISAAILLFSITEKTLAALGLDAPQAVGAYLNGAFPSSTPGPAGSWALADAFPNITFTDPVRMVKDPLSADFVYIVCRNGEVWRIPFSTSVTTAQKVKVLDRTANTWGYWDAGMMSIAFHPDFGVPGNPNRGYFYVSYQYSPNLSMNTALDSPSYIRLSRFTIPDGQLVANPASEFVMIQQYDRHNWHNGGQMFFGPDRFLYLVIGDEGRSDDFYNVAQKINDRLFSGILRIDVDQDPNRSHPIRRQPTPITPPAGWPASFTRGYGIPKDNPWLDPAGGILEEFWSIGMRSPHSMSFDNESGEIWIAEVGQATREEITVARKGGNHQWPYKEGNANGLKPKPASLIGTDVAPVFDYPRSSGGCVIGGIVYRGSLHAGSLTGKYLFGDHNTKALYALTRPESGPAEVDYLTSVLRNGGEKQGLSGICEGPDNEVYFIELGNYKTDSGKIYRLIRSGTPTPDPPRFLSQTGAFTDLATLTPRAGLIPYDVNSPLWSDGSRKQRWIAIPNNGSHDTAAERVTYNDEGAWSFPVGTVLVKHFAMPVDEGNPALEKRLETRFFVHGSDGVYYGVTYRWNDAETDAELLPGGAFRDLTITQMDGTTRNQRWEFPSRADCRTCHTSEADNVLGVRAYQLAKDMNYPLTGRSSNQLETWNALGIFGSTFGSRDPANIAAAVDPLNPYASLDLRVKSYLAANCSHCHHPTGVSANFDASFHVALSAQNIVEGLINRPLQSSSERVVSPNDLANSVLHTRMALVGANQMPSLGKNVVDQKAVALIADWIRGMDSANFSPVVNNSAPVASNDQLSAIHQTPSRLNVLPNDSDANAPLGIGGVSVTTPPSNGTLIISGEERRLIYTHNGSSNRTDSFHYRVTDPQGARSNIAMVNLTIPFDFSAWSACTPGAGGNPDANADGDLSSDLMEFALGGIPNSGASPAVQSVRLLENDGQVSLMVTRPSDRSGLTYEVETSHDLVNWQLAPAPMSSDPNTLVFENLQARPGLSADAGMARLRIRATGWEASAASLPLGWHGVNLGEGSQTVGVPYREVPIFSSAVIAATSQNLTVHGDPALGVGFKGFVEVVSGPFAGRRFEVASATDGGIQLQLGQSIPDLTGSRIVICAHHTIGGLFAKEKFRGSTNPAGADQLQLFDNDGINPGQFQLLYLLDARPRNSIHQWRGFLPGGGDQGARLIAPGQGVFVTRPANSPNIRLIFTGQVRGNAFVQSLQSGNNLVASPFPVAMSPRQRGLLDPRSGFVASTNANLADQVLLYQNNSFRLFYLFDHQTLPDLWSEDIPSSPNYNDLFILSPNEAMFIRKNQASISYTIPLPWVP